MARRQRAHLAGRSVSEACAEADERAGRRALTARPSPAFGIGSKAPPGVLPDPLPLVKGVSSCRG